MNAQVFQLSPHQEQRAKQFMKQAVRDVAYQQGYAVGVYDGTKQWVRATAPLLAIAFGGGVVFAVVVVGWLP